MDNGFHKIIGTNQKPSEAQLAVFQKYAHDGLSNEAISLLTGFSKRTVDKYIQEEPIALNNWNNVKTYAAQQFGKASQDIQAKHNEAIDRKIAALKQQLSELEAMKKPVTVPLFNWTVKFNAPKMAAKTECKVAAKVVNKNSLDYQLYTKNPKYQKSCAAKGDIIKLFSDHQWHTKDEVEAILFSHGYASSPHGYCITLRRMVPDIIVKPGRYVLPT